MSKKFRWVLTHVPEASAGCNVGQGEFGVHIPSGRKRLELAATLPASFRAFNDKGVTLCQGKCDEPPRLSDRKVGDPLPLVVGGPYAQGIEFTSGDGYCQTFIYGVAK